MLLRYLCWVFFFLELLSGAGPSPSDAVASPSFSTALFFPSLFEDVEATGISGCKSTVPAIELVSGQHMVQQRPFLPEWNALTALI